MLLNIRMRMTPSTITAVPRISVGVTAVSQLEHPIPSLMSMDIRVPTSQLANKKLKIKLVAPSGATQSGRSHRKASVDPTTCQQRPRRLIAGAERT